MTQTSKPTITLAEWDAATTEQRAAWLKNGHILTTDDGERLRLRGLEDRGPRTDRICRHLVEKDTCPTCKPVKPAAPPVTISGRSR